jgi:hypothetical protein
MQIGPLLDLPESRILSALRRMRGGGILAMAFSQ